MRLLFRVDDIFLDSSNFELSLFKLFYELQIPIMMGVIPVHLNELTEQKIKENEELSTMINSNVFLFALHGYSHRNNGKWGEFYGIQKESQLQLIAEGKNKLERLLGVRVWSFIPPWNAFDIQTISCLKENEFELISYGHDKRTNDITDNHLSLLRYSVEHLYFLRSHTFMFMLFLRKFGFYKEVTILILFHPYNFEDWLSKKYYTGNKERFNTKLALLQQDLMRLKKNPNVVFSEISALRRVQKFYFEISI